MTNPVILRTGVDLLEVTRLEEAVQRHGQRFMDRIYTPRELKLVGENSGSLAARFAAKEAVAKALGTGIGKVGWHDIEVLRGPQGEPVLKLHGEARQLADLLGLHTWALSLSHTREHAVANVVAIGGDR